MKESVMARASVRRWQAVAAAAVLLRPACASPQPGDVSNSPPNVIDGTQLVEALRGGGYVLYFRHGKTDLSTSDSDRTSLASCATQRILSREGRRQMTDIDKQIQRLRIPVGIVLASSRSAPSRWRCGPRSKSA